MILFIVHSVLQKQLLNSQTSIFLRKVSSNAITAGLLSRNISHTGKRNVAQDKTYIFIISIKEKTSY